jgi:tetratricopeptide (TPR) repeat protein
LDARHDYTAEIKLLDGYIASKPPKKYQYATLLQLGDLTYQTKDYGAAYAWYSQAGTMSAKPAVRDLVGVAESAAAIGDKAAAISSYQDAIKLLPANSPEADKYEDQIRFLGGTP